MTIHEDYSLSNVLWYRIGGKARYVIEAASEKDVKDALHFIREKGIEKVFVVGLGSNLLFTDDYFDGVVLMITAANAGEPDIFTSEDSVTAFAGETLDRVILKALDHNLIGLEWAGGLPGTVGAAVRGNVGAFGGEIKDMLENAQILDTNQEHLPVKTLTNHDLEFVYRGSLIKYTPGFIVLSATFRLKKATDEELLRAREVYEKSRAYRQKNHPLEYPNCGSVFKNIKNPEDVEKVLSVWPDVKEKVEKNWYGKVAMGYIISRLGLVGYRVGNAEISRKHANFIVNLGNAKAQDVKQIIEKVQSEVEKTFGIRPEVEPEIVS